MAVVSRYGRRILKASLVFGRAPLGILAVLLVWGGCSLERAPLQRPSEPLNPRDGGPSTAGDSGVVADGGVVDGSVSSDAGARDAAQGDGSPFDGGQADAGVDAGPGCVPLPEQCDGLDNDCDDQVDESDNGNQVCPCDRDVFAGSTYLFCSQFKTWEAASSECQSLGYTLVTIETEEEDDWISFGSGRTDEWWIGLTRIGSSRYEWVSGVAVWNDDPIGYTNFWDEEPNGGGGRNCGLLLDQSGEWWIERCGRTNRFVCEAPPTQ